MSNVLLCSLCGRDMSLTGPTPHLGHKPDCPARGAHISYLTMLKVYEPGVVAQCRDGHDFWEGTRLRGRLEQQTALANAEVLAHNIQFHWYNGGTP